MIAFSIAKDLYPQMVREAVVKALTATALDVHGEIVNRITQLLLVDTGTFRANWYITVDQETDTYELWEENAPQPVARIQGKIEAGSKVYIQNNLPYAEALENGHAKNKSPDGVIGPIEGTLRNIWEAHMAEVAP